MSISSKAILILPQDFLNFSFYAVESLNIVTLGRYGSKGYTSVVLCYFEVTFLGERSICLYGLSVYTVLQYQSSMSSNFLVFRISGGISSRSSAFLFNIFLITTSYASCVNCPSLMPSGLLIIFVIGLSVIWGDFPSRFLK